MEQRLIDADELKEWVANWLKVDKYYHPHSRSKSIPITELHDILDRIQTIDAVPVVASDRNKLCPINHGLRCKDIENCAFWCEWGQCAVKAIAVACADGERKDGEHEQ